MNDCGMNYPDIPIIRCAVDTTIQGLMYKSEDLENDTGTIFVK